MTVVHDKHATIDANAPIYVHSIDKMTGKFTVYKVGTFMSFIL